MNTYAIDVVFGHFGDWGCCDSIPMLGYKRTILHPLALPMASHGLCDPESLFPLEMACMGWLKNALCLATLDGPWGRLG